MRPNIMIIDDSLDQMELMLAIFSMVDPNLTIIKAMNAEYALKLLKSREEELPRVILLDLKMPKITGLELLAQLKNDSILKTIPICAFSSSDNPKDIRMAYELGASFYFKKPTGLDALKKFAEHFRAIWFDFAYHA